MLSNLRNKLPFSKASETSKFILLTKISLWVRSWLILKTSASFTSPSVLTLRRDRNSILYLVNFSLWSFKVLIILPIFSLILAGLLSFLSLVEGKYLYFLPKYLNLGLFSQNWHLNLIQAPYDFTG